MLQVCAHTSNNDMGSCKLIAPQRMIPHKELFHVPRVGAISVPVGFVYCWLACGRCLPHGGCCCHLCAGDGKKRASLFKPPARPPNRTCDHGSHVEMRTRGQHLWSPLLVACWCTVRQATVLVSRGLCPLSV